MIQANHSCMSTSDNQDAGCKICGQVLDLPFELTMAFQPIVDVRRREVFAHEALVRGSNGESAGEVFSHISNRNRYGFDQSCRVKAIEWAARLKMDSYLSINFLPNAVYEPERCIQTTLRAADEFGFPTDRIIFEITEGERVDDPEHLDNIIQYYKAQGFLTAIDDFGSGYAGLTLLADFHTQLVKLDMGLVRHIDREQARQAIVQATMAFCKSLDMRPIAEGVETRAEFDTLAEMGIELFQGYLFARPGFESLPEVDWSPLD